MPPSPNASSGLGKSCLRLRSFSLSLFSEAGQRIATDQLVQDHDHHESILLSGQGAVGGGLGRVKYRMLHIPGIVNFTYHLHVSMSVLKVLA